MTKLTTFPRRAPIAPSTVEIREHRPQLVTYEEAAQRLGGVTVRHVENLVARGRLKRKGLGKARRIVESSLDRYIEGEDQDG